MRHGDTIRGGLMKGILGVIFNRDGTRILTWSADGTTRLLDVSTGKLVLPPIGERLRGAVWNREENRLLTWSWDGTARLWSLPRLPRGHLIDIAHGSLPDRGKADLQDR